MAIAIVLAAETMSSSVCWFPRYWCSMAPTTAWASGGRVLALLAWILVTAIGTLPINMGALQWRPTHRRPTGALVSRWERLDVIRSSAALLAFACLRIAAAFPASAS
jgi:hypothetical protein